MSLLKQINESANSLQQDQILLELLNGYSNFIFDSEKNIIVESAAILLDRIEQSISKHPSEPIVISASKVLAHLEAIRTGVNKSPNVKELLDTASERGANKFVDDVKKITKDSTVLSKIDQFSAKIKEKITNNQLEDVNSLIKKIREFLISGKEAFGSGKGNAPD